MNFETLAIHEGQAPDPAYGAVIQPIYQVSTFAYKSVNEIGQFEYSRFGNPTRKALEDCLAVLEGGKQGFAFATGMAAQITVLALISAGEHIIVHDDLYGGTYKLLTTVIAKQGIEVEFINLRDLPSVKAAIKPNTKMIWAETPTNPLMNILDLKAIADLAKENNIITICDNTFLSPYLQNPLKWGIDIVIHSTSKYINGHSDVIGGAIIVDDEKLGEEIGFYQNAMGTCQAPQDCYLVLRGVKTLAVRMEAHNKNAMAVAKWLEAHPKIECIHYPGLTSHPEYELATRQANGYGGMLSFCVKGGEEAAFKLLSNLKLFVLALSLGGVESLIEHPWSMTHQSMPEDVRLNLGITNNMIRASIGIEHVDDIIGDLSQALDKI